MNRRTFVQLSTGALLSAASSQLLADAPAAPAISSQAGTVHVSGANYSWEYSSADDKFSLRDLHKRLIVTGRLQPAVVVADAADSSHKKCVQGKLAGSQIDADRVTFTYEAVNGSSRLLVTWRFDSHGIWTEPVIYETTAQEDVISLHYFSEVSDPNTKPSLHATYLVVPGLSDSSTISPIVRDNVGLDESVWLGRGSRTAGLHQQWGLPVHYFAGFSLEGWTGLRGMFTEGRSDAFCCGLSDLPGGDFFLQLQEGNCGPWVDYRSDLWKHVRGPGRLSLGATLLWSVASNYYEAIAAYYQQLVAAGIIHRHQDSARKTAVALTPEFCTWGPQVARNKAGDHLDEAFLTKIYSDLKDSGMRPGLFSIDDKWEEAYGNLVHSTSRLPHFERFLDQLRADGYKIGLWAALMRCERPADIGLSEENMLKQPDGKPYIAGSNPHYYLLDFTQPAVAQVLSGLVRKFIRRYKPDLFKFDFGYELPAVSVAAPQDKSWTGERLMWKGLEVVIKAMREENPDLVVMYYQLSPLFLEYFDLHSTDDLFLNSGEYDLEANRRIYFSSLLGPLGIPTYGSSGYDWASAPSIWFDSAAVGTIGSLNDFRDDEEGEGVTPALAAKYNGVAKVLRSTSIFEVLPLGTISQAATFGAHARSWARFEAGELVLLAFRPTIHGEENPLALESADLRVRDVVHSDTPVILSSRDALGITRSRTLAVVSYGGGEIVLRRQQGKQAQVTSHYFGGAVVQSSAAVKDGLLRITASQGDHAGNPLEWMDVRIS